MKPPTHKHRAEASLKPKQIKKVGVYGIYDDLGQGIWREFEVNVNKTDELKRKAMAHLSMPYEKDEDLKSRLYIILNFIGVNVLPLRL